MRTLIVVLGIIKVNTNDDSFLKLSDIKNYLLIRFYIPEKDVSRGEGRFLIHKLHAEIFLQPFNNGNPFKNL